MHRIGLVVMSRLQEFCHQTRPAGLVACAHATARIAMEIFVEQDVILEMRIRREFGVILQDRTLTVFAFQK